MPIPFLPELTDDLIDARDDGRLVIFTGAGASRLLGCKGWDQMARELVEDCYRKDYIKFLEREELANDPDHRKTLTICRHIFDENDDSGSYMDAVKDSLKLDADAAERSPIYDQLVRIKPAFHVTTEVVPFV